MQRRSGLPQIGVRLPSEQFHAVRVEARQRGIPASHVLKEMVAARYQTGISAACPAPEQAALGAPMASHAAQNNASYTITGMLRDAMRAPTRAASPTSTVRDNHQNGVVPVMPTRVPRSATRADDPAAGNQLGRFDGLAGLFRD